MQRLSSPFTELTTVIPQLHSYFLVSEGIIDQATINHGKLSWHHVDGVGSTAFNDALLLEGAVYQLAREHFRREPYYVDLLELLHETRHPAYFRNPVPVSTTELRFVFFHKLMPGWDSTLTNFLSISEFSKKLPRLILYAVLTHRGAPSQRAINIYKSAIYSFYLPMALSMIICGFPVESASPMDLNYYDLALDILLPLGEYAHIQREYFESRTGNLAKGRSWCYDLVRSTGSPEQLATLDSHFGKEDTTSQLHIRSVFAEAGIDLRYSLYAEGAYSRIGALIDALPELRSPSGDAVLGRAIFRKLLEDLHSRTD